MVGAGQVRYNGRLRVTFDCMEHIASGDAVTAELARIRIILNLQNTPSNVSGMGREKSLDVVAVNGKATVEAPLPADGHDSSQTS